MAETNYSLIGPKSTLTLAQLVKSLAEMERLDARDFLAFRAIGSQDFGLNTDEEYGWELLGKLGISQVMLKNIRDLLTQAGCSANEIYNASIARFSGNPESGLNVVPLQALKLSENVKQHLYN